MNIKNVILIIVLLAITFSACNTIYKQSKLYQQQKAKIARLKMSEKSSNPKIDKRHEKALADKDKVIAKHSPSDRLATDSIDAASTSVGESMPKPTASILQDTQINYSIKSQRLDFKTQTFDIIIIEDSRNLSFFWREKDRPFGSLSRLREHFTKKKHKELLFAMNAGMYRPNLLPQGLYVEDGQEVTPLDEQIEGYGNFYMQPNGVFLIDECANSRIVKTADYPRFQAGVKHATQSGPMLVADGVINKHFNEGSNSLNIRNGVGIDPGGRVIFVISNKRVNLYTFASLFKDHFQCHNALYLDGAISKMYLPALDREDNGGTFGPMIGIVRDNEEANRGDE